MTVGKPTVDKLEVNQTDSDEVQEELYEELSALEQAMVSEERQNEGTFLTGGNTREFVELQEEKELDENIILNPAPVLDGPPLLEFLRSRLHKFDSPYAYIGGEANSPDASRYHTSSVRILIARLSTYESTSLSMSHCLHPRAKITMADGSLKMIKDLVVEGQSGESHEVLSYNRAEGRIEPKKVTGYFNNGLRDDLVGIYYSHRGTGGKGLQGDKRVRMTSDHKVWSQSRKDYVLAKDLEIGEKVLVEDPYSLSGLQEQVIRGTLLGDASLVLTKRGAQVRYGQSFVQTDYFNWKREIFDSLTVTVGKTTKKHAWDEGRILEGWQASTVATEEVRQLFYDDLYSTGHREPNREYLDKLTPLGVAVWFMDDGNLAVTEQDGTVTRIARLHTEGFSDKGLQTIQDYFKDIWEIEFRRSYRGSKGYALLYLGKEDTDKFLSKIGSYIAPSMTYKAREGYSRDSKQPIGYVPVAKDHGFLASGWSERTVTRVEPLSGKHTVYCIEVEDNHNMFVDGLLTSNSLMAQIYAELPFTFCDLAFLPKPNDYDMLRDNGFPVWFGTNTKLAPKRFDVLSITHAVSMEQLNFVSLLHDSGIPLFKNQRMEREDIPLVIVGGANSGTTAPLSGSYFDSKGNEYAHFIDAVIYGDGEEAAKEFMTVVKEGKEKGWKKREILRACHDRVPGFYEPDCYVHSFDGKGSITSIEKAPGREYAALPVNRATVENLDNVRTLEEKILPYTGDGASVDVAIAGSVGCHRAGTLVATDRGRIPIEQVKAGDRVVTQTGMKRVSKLWKNGQRQFYRLKTAWGFEVESTEDHEYLTARRKDACVKSRYYQSDFAHLGCLKKGDLLVVREGCSASVEPQLGVILTERDEMTMAYTGTTKGGGRPAHRKNISQPEKLTFELAELMGYLEGDGSLSEDSVRFFYAWHESELQVTYDEWMGRLFGLQPGERQDQGGAYEIPYNSRQAREFFQKLGVKSRTGVPTAILLATSASKAAYLRGLFTADGTAAGPQATISVFSTDKELMKGVQQLLLDLGIFSALDLAQKAHKKKGTEYECKDLWRVSVRGPESWERFKTLVGFSLKAKQNALVAYSKRNSGTYGRFQGDWAADSVVSIEPTEIADAYDLKVEGDPTYTVNGLTVHNCIGSAGWGACSFCREGSEGPYRERSLGKVMDALDAAVKMQGTKEVSFFSLNFNQYADFFPLVEQSVKRGYKVGLISQRIDMLAETPEQIKVQRWLKKSNFTLGVEGISGRTRAYLNKNLQEWEILLCAAEMMKEGAGELKLFQIVTGLEQSHDVDEFCSLMEKLNAIRAKLGSTTRFRVSFTPLFPSAFTALQFAPCNAAIMHGERSLDKLFQRAKELGWGRRLSVSGEEPLVSNTINHGGRNITHILLKSHFADGYRFYGNVPKGTWARWAKRIEQDPNIDLDITWGEKSFEYIFPWEDINYSTSKEILWRGYMKAVAFQGVTYCLSTRTIKGVCHLNECGCCDPDKDGKPNAAMIKSIVGRRVAPTIPTEKIAAQAQSREKSYHLRVLFRSTDPIHRFVMKGYFQNAIPRALMLSSPKIADAYIGPLGHARIAAGANMARDWTFGHNIYDFSLSEYIPEAQLKEAITKANEFLREGEILQARMDTHLTVLRNDVDYAVYSIFVPNQGMNFRRIRNDIERYMERKTAGKDSKIKVKKTQGKGIFVTVEQTLDGKDIRAISYQFMPDYRGTLVRMVISGNFNPMAMLEAITNRKAFTWKEYPIYCDGYVQLAQETGEADVFASLFNEAQTCSATGGPLEMDLFTGQKLQSGVSLAADGGLDLNYPIDMNLFFTKHLQAIDLDQEVAA